MAILDTNCAHAIGCFNAPSASTTLTECARAYRSDGNGNEPGNPPTIRLNEKLGYGYDAAGNLSTRTNNALAQSFAPNDLNQLSS
jgi:hypothetical protein